MSGAGVRNLLASTCCLALCSRSTAPSRDPKQLSVEKTLAPGPAGRRGARYFDVAQNGGDVRVNDALITVNGLLPVSGHDDFFHPPFQPLILLIGLLGGATPRSRSDRISLIRRSASAFFPWTVSLALRSLPFEPRPRKTCSSHEPRLRCRIDPFTIADHRSNPLLC